METDSVVTEKASRHMGGSEICIWGGVGEKEFQEFGLIDKKGIPNIF